MNLSQTSESWNLGIWGLSCDERQDSATRSGVLTAGSAAERIERWNGALLEQLLPLAGEPGDGVLLACDDETLRSAAAAVGVEAAAAADRFAADVRTHFAVGQIAGFGGARRPLHEFSNAAGERGTPPFLSLLCLCVLAASRMAPDESHSTGAYYVHLRSLLGLSGRGELPHMDVLPRAFHALADWLDRDLEGLRGRLVLPAQPLPPYVGVFVSQTVFRRRDREQLSEFFAARMAANTDGYDPLLRLRRWPGRRSLTRHARELLDDDRFAPRVRAAIRTARGSWDGSIVSAETGGRVWPLTLRLLPYPPRLHAAAANTLPVKFTLAGAPLTLEPGGAVELPWRALDALRGGGVLGDPGSEAGALRVSAAGEVFLFELGDDGLAQVAQPAAETVWVVSADRELNRRFEGRVVPAGDLLAKGWRILRDVAVSELSGVERAIAHSTQLPFALEGGLPLEPRVYLAGGPPTLQTGELDELDGFLPVYVNGAEVGRVGSGDRLHLPGEPGSYDVRVGDGEWQPRYHIEKFGEPVGVGDLIYPLAGARAFRGGASPRTGVADVLCGAALSTRYQGALPLLARQRLLLSIGSDGSLEPHTRPPTPAWFEIVGLGDGRWELIRPDAAWALSPSSLPGGSGRARRLHAPAPVELDRHAAEAVLALGRSARTNDPDGWQQLVELAVRTLAAAEMKA